MAVTSVGAIYATGSLLLQRIYIPDADDSEISNQFVLPGETLVRIPQSTYQLGGSAAVQAAIGTPSFSGRCVIVDNTSTVIGSLKADPALYTDPQGRQIIAHDRASIGDTWTGTIFTRPFAEYVPATGIITVISTQNIDSPTVVTAGDQLLSLAPGSTLQVGQLIPKKAAAAA
jgi:hypothetical protein